MATARWTSPEISSGSFFALTICYSFDIARSSGQGHTSELAIFANSQYQCLLQNAGLLRRFRPPRAAISVTTLNDNLEKKGGSRLLSDFAVAIMLARSAVGSLEIGVPVVKDYTVLERMISRSKHASVSFGEWTRYAAACRVQVLLRHHLLRRVREDRLR